MADSSNRNLILLGVVSVSSVLGVLAMVLLGPDTGEPSPAPAPEPVAEQASAPRTVKVTPPPRPQPRNLRPDRPQLRSNLPKPTHDFAQTYDASPEGLQEAVQAREQRIVSCLGVHGVPQSDEPEVFQVVATLAMGDEEHGKADLEAPHAHYDLAGCLSLAMEDATFPNPPDGIGLTMTLDVPIPYE
ncbi:MAG: hypothetical protein KTR31_15935 [Myxococcales bacterium]|nr:hypothetical protein [Myxococcales bacterium]